ALEGGGDAAVDEVDDGPVDRLDLDLAADLVLEEDVDDELGEARPREIVAGGGERGGEDEDEADECDAAVPTPFGSRGGRRGGVAHIAWTKLAWKAGARRAAAALSSQGGPSHDRRRLGIHLPGLLCAQAIPFRRARHRSVHGGRHADR